MGNRAVITTSKNPDATAIYLHWNGGIESVLAFLGAAKELGVRDPAGDETYAMARLAQIIGNFFGGTNSIGIGPLSTLDVDNWDNGTYVVGAGWEIVERYGKGSKPQMAAPESSYREMLDRLLKVNGPIFNGADA